MWSNVLKSIVEA